MGLTIVTNKGSGLQSELRPDVNTIAILFLVYVATSFDAVGWAAGRASGL